MADKKREEQREREIEAFKKRQEEEAFYAKLRKIVSAGSDYGIYHLFPTVEDFCAFRDTRKHFGRHGTILHFIAEEQSTHCRDEFLERIMEHYFPADADEKTLQMRKELLLTRNSAGRLCANYDMAKHSLPKLDWRNRNTRASNTGTTINTDNAIASKYKLLKSWIKEVTPEPETNEERHPIADVPNPHSGHEAGRPVDSNVILTSDSENAGIIVPLECFPPIALRRVPENDNDKDEVVIVKNIAIDPKYGPQSFDKDISFVDRVIKQLDFPEDWQDYYPTLEQFEANYRAMREDEGQFSTLRHFVQNRGTIFFEDKRDNKVNVNIVGGDYGGYARSVGKYPYIVLRTNIQNPNTILHELFHTADLRGEATFSASDMVKFALMLTQTNPDTQNKHIFRDVDGYYKVSEYEKEILARVMENHERDYLEDTLLRRVYQLGHLFARSKVDDIPAIQNRIEYAMQNLPNKKELDAGYREFTDIKSAKDEMIKAGKTKAQAELAMSEQLKDFANKHEQLFTQARTDLEKNLTELVRTTAYFANGNIPSEAKKVELHPYVQELFTKQNPTFPEVNFATQIEHVKINSQNKADIYLEKMADINTTDKDFFVYHYLYCKETGQNPKVKKGYFADTLKTSFKEIRESITKNYQRYQMQKELYPILNPDKAIPDTLSYFDASLINYIPGVTRYKTLVPSALIDEKIKEIEQVKAPEPPKAQPDKTDKINPLPKLLHTLGR